MKGRGSAGGFDSGWEISPTDQSWHAVVLCPVRSAFVSKISTCACRMRSLIC